METIIFERRKMKELVVDVIQPRIQKLVSAPKGTVIETLDSELVLVLVWNAMMTKAEQLAEETGMPFTILQKILTFSEVTLAEDGEKYEARMYAYPHDINPFIFAVRKKNVKIACDGGSTTFQYQSKISMNGAV